MINKPINSKTFCILAIIALVIPTAFIAAPTSAQPSSITFTTCDSSGNAKTVFNPGWSDNGVYWNDVENMYFTAAGLSPSTTYPIYVFIKNDGWTLGTSFSAIHRFSHTASSITTDSSGNVVPTSVYTNMAAGEYTVVVDVNNDGIYNAGDLIVDPVEVTLTIVSTDGYDVLSMAHLTMPQIYAMPTYTGVGCPRRSGGYYPPEQIGNYTGVPMQFICNVVGGMSTSSLCMYATAVDGYSTSQSYSQIYTNNWPQYNITEGLAHQYGGDTAAKLSGQSPMTILAYKVNSTRLPSDGTGGDNDLGGPLRDFVVSNNGTSDILANDGMATFGTTFCKYLTSIVIMNPAGITLSTSDSEGTAQSSFNLGDDIYFSATGLNRTTSTRIASYPIYVINHQSAWTTRIPLPDFVSTVTITTDSAGNLPLTDIYTNAAPGSYDIIVDKNVNGQFDDNDLILTNIISTPGPALFVVPEYAYGALLSIAACFVAFIAYVALKKHSAAPNFSLHPKTNL